MTDLEAPAAESRQRTQGRRDRKKQQTRAALMTAALRLVDQRGLDRVTVEEISEAADVSPRTFFNYFATKDDAIIGDAPGETEELSQQLLAVTPGVPVLGALLLVLLPAVEQMQAERDLWILRMRVIANNPALLPALFARGGDKEQQLIMAIAKRTGLGPESDFPPLVASVTGAAFRTAMIRWATGDGARSLSDYVHEAFGMLAAGLADPAEPAHPH